MRKHGSDSFHISFLCEGLDKEEQIMISLLKPEYNMTDGGEGGNTSNSPNYKRAMLRRDYSGENNPNYGKRGPDNPKYGKTYGPKPNISRSKKKKVLSSDNICFFGVQDMLQFYNAKSYFSLRKKGIDWEAINE